MDSVERESIGSDDPLLDLFIIRVYRREDVQCVSWHSGSGSLHSCSFYRSLFQE